MPGRKKTIYVKEGKQKDRVYRSLYFNRDEFEKIKKIEQILYDYDRIRYGKEKVDAWKKSREKYTFNYTLRWIIDEYGEKIIKDLLERIEEEKQKRVKNLRKEKKKDPLAKLILGISPIDDYIWEKEEV